MTEFSDYDFIDFGASKGGSIEFASAAFGGKGLGIDIDPKKIAELRRRGHDGMVADATKLNIPDDAVDYAVMMNFLEHLPSAETARLVVEQAVRVSREFVFILGPNFDDLDYLRKVGLKKFYADWKVHTWHHTRSDLSEIMDGIGFNYHVIETERIRRSSHKYLLPLSTPPDQDYYDEIAHPPKSDFRLKQSVYGWITVIIQIGKCDPLSIFAEANGYRVKPAIGERRSKIVSASSPS